MVLFEDIKKYLDAPRLSDEGISAIREYFSNTNAEYTQKIVYRLLDEVEDYREESKNLGDIIAGNILKK
jgi:adenine C2-methylase RlmN of 23S rRNA A2503 and tRNA A37